MSAPNEPRKAPPETAGGVLQGPSSTESGSAFACAIIVTYWPTEALLAHVSKLRNQVAALVLVDNTPGTESVELLEEISRRHSCILIRNHVNAGIATALNIGARWAISQGFAFVALFDQDSSVPEGYIKAMLSEYNSDAERDKVGLIAPRYKDPTTGVLTKIPRLAPDGAPLEIMTSGSLIPVKVFSLCGFFREDFFIDQVDHEFSFRLRNFGYKVHACPTVFLLHAAGQPRRHKFFGLFDFSTTHHSALRRYYMTRNSLYMVLRYGYLYPKWALQVCVSLVVIIPIKVVLAEEQKLHKLACISRGVADALLNRLGQRSERGS
jgi:rhamnosyltransferase